MKLRYRIETVDLQGQSDSQVQGFEADEIVIGRGGRSSIIFDSKLISLEHAKLSSHEGSVTLSDLDSLSGTKVNGSLVRHAVLKAGDRIRLGDVLFHVSQEDGVWTITEKRETKERVDDSEKAAAIARSLSPVAHLPSLGFLSVFFASLIVAIFFILPLMGKARSSWSSGPVSNNHAMIENDCGACHVKPFEPVQDDTCVSCHNMSEHAEVLPQLIKDDPSLNIRCASCHMEHNGNHGLIADESSMCSDCHAEITAVNADSEIQNVWDFNEHPEFQVSLFDYSEDYDKPSVTRVRLDDKEKLIDPGGVKLNHKVHLDPEGINGPDGKLVMQCNDCHHLSADFKTLEPVTFERDCESCHTLGFDERLPGSEVPHGNPDVVFNYLYAEYAKLFLMRDGELKGAQDFNIRRKPGYQSKKTPTEVRQFTRKYIQAESRVAEKLLFSRTACQLCHFVDEIPSVGEEARLSKYTVQKPHIPERWMPASTYSHGAHEEIMCESCHAGVKESEKTTDVLLPSVENCKNCHHGPKSSDHVQSDCVQCHSYHDSMQMEFENKRELDDVIVAMQTKYSGRVIP